MAFNGLSSTHQRLTLLLLLAIVLAIALHAPAQEVGAIRVSGATLEGEYWGALYTLKTCTDCTSALDHEPDGPVIEATLLRIYRADSNTGTITVEAVLRALAEFRTQLGEQILQRINVVHPFETALCAEDSGPPSQELRAAVSFEWEPGLCEVVVPVNITMGANTWGSTLLWENGIAVTPTIQVRIIILPPEPNLMLNPSHEADGIAGPLLVLRDSAGLSFTLRGCGVSPILKLGTVRLDGTELIESPYPEESPFGPVAAPGHFITQRLQPTGEPLIDVGAVGMSAAAWISNVAGCCRGSTSATLSLPEDLPLGRHRLNVTFEPVGIVPSPLSSSTASPIEIEQAFILFGPEISLSSESLSPGDGLEIRGTGFPPNSTVRVFARVRILGSDDREIDLGTAMTHLDGSFDETFQLPDEGSDFWLDLALWKLDSPRPHQGLIRVFINDPEFHLGFARLDSELAYCRTDVLPEDGATGDCPIRVGVLRDVTFLKPQ